MHNDYIHNSNELKLPANSFIMLLLLWSQAQWWRKESRWKQYQRRKARFINRL